MSDTVKQGNLVTPKFRGSYAHLMKPKMNDEGVETYELLIVLPKDSPATKKFIAALEARFEASMEEKIGKLIPFERCKHFPITDGDDKDEEQFHDHWLISSKNKRQPGVLVLDDDGTRRPVERESEIYSGAWYHASISTYAWDNKFGKGVSVSLEGVLKIKDDTKFGGSFSESDFDGVSEAGSTTSKKRRPVEDDEPAPRAKKRRAVENDDEPPF